MIIKINCILYFDLLYVLIHIKTISYNLQNMILCLVFTTYLVYSIHDYFIFLIFFVNVWNNGINENLHGMVLLSSSH